MDSHKKRPTSILSVLLLLLMMSPHRLHADLTPTAQGAAPDINDLENKLQDLKARRAVLLLESKRIRLLKMRQELTRQSELIELKRMDAKGKNDVGLENKYRELRDLLVSARTVVSDMLVLTEAMKRDGRTKDKAEELDKKMRDKLTVLDAHQKKISEIENSLPARTGGTQGRP